MNIRFASVLITLFFAWLTWYFFLPTFSWNFADGFGWLLFNAVVFFVSSALINEYEFGDKVIEIKAAMVVIVFCLFMLIILPLFSTWSLFHASSYRSILGEVKTKTANTIMSPIDPENVVIIDAQTAHRIADKTLGSSDIALGSESTIGELTLQKVGDKLYYVAPLLHSGFFKWWSNGDRGTKGFIMVNATNDKDVKLVQKVNGEDVSIVYQPEACFSQNIERHIYMNGYMTTGFTDFSFEVDDSLKPYYVVTLYDNMVGYSGSDVIGVLTVDVKTGEIKEYSTENVPSWVDRIHPQDFVETQINDWGEYVHGWWNPSDKDKVCATEGISLVYGDDGQCYFYTGISSVGSDQSSVGFMLVNSRTKEVYYYKQSGATEEAARRSAEGKVQEKGYESTHPRPYNIDGIWSYVMALKDKEGLIKSVAIVSVSNYEVVGVGDDIRSAIRNYKSALNSTGNSIVPSTKGESNLLQGKVKRISTDVRNGNTYYYILIEKNENKIFVATSTISEELPLTIVGDSIAVDFDDSGNSFIDAKMFDNLNLNPQKTKGQENSDKYFKNVSDSINVKQIEINVESVWENLSPKEKEDLLKKANSK